MSARDLLTCPCGCWGHERGTGRVATPPPRPEDAGEARRTLRIAKTTMERLPFCVYCGEPDPKTVDHVIPQSRGGGHTAGNLASSCGSCNSSKNDRTPDEWARSGRAPKQLTLFAPSSPEVLW